MSKRVFTTSRDGVNRCTLRSEQRVTEDELLKLEAVARYRGQTIKQLLNSALTEGLAIACEQYDDFMKDEETGEND